MSIKQAIEALEKLIDYSTGQLCLHEDTYRGGVLWEICRTCGAKWSDDEGGRPEWTEPKQIIEARAALAALRSMPQGEPLFYYRPCMDGLYEGPHHARSVLGKMLREERPNDWHPLYAAHVPETNFGNTPHTAPVPQGEPDVADIIAGALPTSRAHAYELMRQALKDATPPTEAVRMSEAEIRRWWSSENGFEDLDMCKIDDFRTMVRAVEQATAARLGVKMGDV